MKGDFHVFFLGKAIDGFNFGLYFSHGLLIPNDGWL